MSRLPSNHLLLASLLLLGGCTAADPERLRPWEEVSPKSPQSGAPDYGPALPPGQPYTVKAGDTLYAIAFRLGIDFRELAALNKIDPPYIIKVNQTLQTEMTAAPESRNRTIKVRSTEKTTASTPKVKNKVTKTTAVTKSSQRSDKSKSAGASQAQSTARWRWPSSGAVVRSYSANLHKGIDIAGRRGEPVTAVAGGKVVYAGTGVTGYGALLIIKHNETYLSAYGHNETLLVGEGSDVTAGQRIATMGSSGTDSVKLHFEIRRRGQPIDPLSFVAQTMTIVWVAEEGELLWQAQKRLHQMTTLKLRSTLNTQLRMRP